MARAAKNIRNCRTSSRSWASSLSWKSWYRNRIFLVSHSNRLLLNEGAGHALWLLGAAVIGFAVSWTFSGILRFRRAEFVLAHALVAGGFVAAYFHWSGLNLVRPMRSNWIQGFAAAALGGSFVVANVLSQPSSPSFRGFALAFALFWEGLVYGLADSLLLTVVPVAAASTALSSSKHRWIRAAGGLVASVAITSAYHLGFDEFRGLAVVGPIVGNAVLTLAYLASSSPLAPILGHVAMHVAAVLHGIDTSIQLPPHY